MRPTFGSNNLENTRARIELVKAGVLNFDASQWEPWPATRCALGVFLVVGAAIVTGHISYGALAGLGALYIGFASYRGVFRSRLRAMFVTATGTTAMTVIGCMVGNSDLATLTVVPIVTFGFALYATSSQLANSVATQAVCVLLVLAGLRLGPENALGNGALVLGGGLVQIFLLTVVWPVNPRFPERKSISDAYRSLAEFFDRDSHPAAEMIPGTQRFEDARSILQEARTYRWRPEHELMVELMRAGETLRAASVGFAQASEALGGEEALEADRLAMCLARGLRLVSSKILAGRFGELKEAAAVLPACGVDLPELAHWYGILQRQLSDLSHTNPHILDDPLTAPREGTGWRRAFAFLTKLPDVGALRQVALGHAVRYTTTVEIALAISRRLHESHLYWLPLTVAIVLRPDFATTLTRGVGRLAGTVIGVVLAGAVIPAFHPSKEVLSLLAIVSTWFCFALLQPNYTLYSIAITAYVVFSVGSASLNFHHPGAAVIRLAATLMGSGLAIAAYIFWPAFQGRQLRQVIAEALAAQIVFGAKMRNFDEGAYEGVEEARNHARQLRLRSEAFFQTAALEPWGVSTDELRITRAAILRLDQNAAELLALRADEEADPTAIDRILASSESLRTELVAG